MAGAPAKLQAPIGRDLSSAHRCCIDRVSPLSAGLLHLSKRSTLDRGPPDGSFGLNAAANRLALNLLSASQAETAANRSEQHSELERRSFVCARD